MVGNVKGFQTLRCDRCGDDVVVVPEGLLWDHRQQSHRPLGARQYAFGPDRRALENAWEAFV